MNTSQTYLDLYARYRDQLMSVAPDAMNACRDEAIRTFGHKGLPTLKVEEYKYTDTERAFGGDYHLSVATAKVTASDAPVVVNNDELLNRYYGSCVDMSDPIVALNTAFASECLCIHVGRNQHVERPLEITDVLRAQTDTMEHKRILIVLDECASLTILMHYTAADQQHFLTTQVVEVVAGDGAHLDLYEIEETHSLCTRFNTVAVNVGRNATVRHNGITLWGGITRNTITVSLKGEMSEVTLNGCVMADKHQHVDTNTVIRHEVPRCTSHELYKYVVDEQATGAFAGKVYVAPGAQQTQSDEVNQNICIGSESHMYTQPMLEIYADDVKCSHGSTVGKLDETALFYMRQRGIPRPKARQLLIQAFIGQVVDYIPLQPLRERLHIMVERRLGGDLDTCAGCTLCK